MSDTTGKAGAGLALAALLIGGVLGFNMGKQAAQPSAPSPMPSATAVTEDESGWDGLRQGNHVARVDGLLLFNLDSLTGDPYQDCLALLDLWQLTTEDHAGFASVELCEPIHPNR